MNTAGARLPSWLTGSFRPSLTVVLAFVIGSISGTAMSAVLPEDRADLLYHSYDGGGVTISGPSLLVRKEFADKVSVAANYYVDRVTGASIDVQATASPYVEERTETSVSADYLHDRTLMSMSYTASRENDYDADAVSFGVSQEFFGAMTTLSLGVSLGDDTVRRNDDPTFAESLQRRRYNLSLSQVLTKSWIVALNLEAVVDEGYLNNPYRVVRFLEGESVRYQPEEYPRTRASDAVALRSNYFLPYRATAYVEARSFTDSWGIGASHFTFGYTHPVGKQWLLEGRARFYQQDQAEFYADLFPFRDAQNFLARDKELSTFSSTQFGIGASYEFNSPYLSAFEKTRVHLFWDRLQFDYDNFRDDRVANTAPGEEPLYSFNADVVRLFLSVSY